MEMHASRPLAVSQQQAVCQALETTSAQIREQAAQVADSWTSAQHSQAQANERLDENGCLVDGDKIMYICAKYLSEKRRLKNDTVVTTVMSNLGFRKAIENIGFSR